MDIWCSVTFAVSIGLFLGAGYFYALTWRIRRDAQKHLDDASKIHESTQKTLTDGESINQSTEEMLAKIEEGKLVLRKREDDNAKF